MTALLGSADWGRHRYMDGEWHPLMGLLMLLLLGAVIGVVIGLWRRRHTPVATAPATPATPAPPVSPTHNAEAILAERLARSEISPDDYRTLLAALRGQPPSA